MKNRRFVNMGVALAVVTGIAATDFAPANAQAARIPGQRRQERRNQIQNMTPEQRQQREQQRAARRQQWEQRRQEQTRNNLIEQGFTNKDAQNAILEFVKAKEAAREPIRELARKLSEALRDQDVTDAEITNHLKELRDAITAEKARTEAAEKELDAKINYSTNARLDALLTSQGVLGDESFYSGLAGGGRGGQGGFGGGRGGRGGQGGFGGQGGGFGQ